MNFITADWMSEMELVDAAFIPKWQMNHPINDPSSVENLDVNLFSPSVYTTTTPTTDPAVSETDIKNKDFYNRNTQKACSFPCAKMIAFGNASAHNRKVKIEVDTGSLGEMNFEDPKISQTSIQKLYAALEFRGEPAVKRSIARTTLQAQQDHVQAERKRREKLSELFVSLSTMIPGLKKLDKASILGGTIEQIKRLEERLKTLEKQQKKRKNEETVVSAYPNKQLRLVVASSNDHIDTSSSDDTNLDQQSSAVPEIEVRTSCDGNVLLRVHCSKKTGVIKEILCEVEKLGLCIINSSAMPFGDSTLHISVIAQMNEDFCLLEKSLEEKVQQAILKLS